MACLTSLTVVLWLLVMMQLSLSTVYEHLLGQHTRHQQPALNTHHHRVSYGKLAGYERATCWVSPLNTQLPHGMESRMHMGCIGWWWTCCVLLPTPLPLIRSLSVAAPGTLNAMVVRLPHMATAAAQQGAGGLVAAVLATQVLCRGVLTVSTWVISSSSCSW